MKDIAQGMRQRREHPGQAARGGRWLQGGWQAVPLHIEMWRTGCGSTLHLSIIASV